MHNVLFSIKPSYSKKIFSGEKQFEFRKKCCKRLPSRIIIYETAPTSKIIGEVIVSEVLIASPDALWAKTQHAAGISKEEFDRYFSQQDDGIAYCLRSPVLYGAPVSLASIGISSPPQSYCYISQEIHQNIIQLSHI